MEIEGERTLKVRADVLWAALTDAQVLKRCIPGCERVSLVGPNAWDVQLSVNRGSVNSQFRGRLMTTAVELARGGTFVFDGDGGAAGAVRGTARVTLEPVGEHDTRLAYRCELQLGGRLSRVEVAQIEAVSAQLMHELSLALGCESAPAPQAAAPALATPPNTLLAFKRWLAKWRA